MLAKPVRGRTLPETIASSTSYHAERADHEATGTNDHLLINEIIQDLPAYGGLIDLGDGIFNLGGKLVVDASYMNIRGQDAATILKPVEGVNDHVIELGNGASYIEGIKLSNLIIDGNKEHQSGTSHGLYFNEKIKNCYLNDIKILNTLTDGIKIYAANTAASNVCLNNFNNIYIQTPGGNGVTIINSHGNQFDGCRIDNPSVDGFHVESVGSGQTAATNFLLNTSLSGAGNDCIKLIKSSNNAFHNVGLGSAANIGIEIGDGITQCYNNYFNMVVTESCYKSVQLYYTVGTRFINSYFSTAKRQGIYLSVAHNTLITDSFFYNVSSAATNTYDTIFVRDNSLYTVIKNNIFAPLSGVSYKPKYLVEELSGSDYTLFEDNQVLADSYGTGVVNFVGAHSKAKGNIGYITENSGASAVENGQTSITVTHGLAITPSVSNISIIPTSWGDASKWKISNIGATTFDVIVDTDPGASTFAFGWRIVS